MIAPITRKKGRTPYTGPDNVEALLTVLGDLPRDAKLERSCIHQCYAQLDQIG